MHCAFLSLLIGLAAALKPHIIHILADDLGFHDVGFKTDNLIKTPHIDRFAGDGLVLDQYYVQSVCSPTRAAMMTGRYPLHNTVVDWLRTGHATALPLNETLMPQVLAKAGYRSHMSGKWHLGLTTWQHTPTFRGFESYVGYYTGGEGYFDHKTAGLYDFRRDPRPNCGAGCSKVAFDGDTGKYSAHIFTEEAVRIIRNHDAEAAPLFLYLAFQSVHLPRQVPNSYVEPYEKSIHDKVRREFAGMVSCMDEGVGNVTKALESRGMLDNSLIIFSTDNGGLTTDDGLDYKYTGSSNYPLKGGKHSIWEGGTRGLGVVWAGAKTGLIDNGRRGSVAHHLIHAVDWLATYCGVAGISEVCASLPLDGIDQSGPLFHGSPAVREEVFYGTHDSSPQMYQPYDSAIRDGEGWKLIQGTGGKPSSWSQPGNTSLAAQETLHVSRDARGPIMLFNVLSDPEERHEISSQHPAIVARLSKRINELRATQEEVVGGGTHEDTSCPAYGHDHTDPMAGPIVEPWCDHEGDPTITV
eukprot:TRINITY_DN5263_c0_g2_i1.p1 TRINITY_DN5263_c0_g2~~TRINITY_DN5263_c0_g2_i1.p1  ORF type:complete len:525 (-),score=53.98 TRINITY_DN5263_c0_g2_i1:42-1616(-)